MFVLLFGLMGVAAIFPVGNHYAGESEKYDRDVALVDAAFGELGARGLLRPERWLYASATAGAPTGTIMPVIEQTNDNARRGQFLIGVPTAATAASVDHPGYAYVIDPLGAAAAAAAGTPDAWAFPWYDMAAFGDETVANAFMPPAWQSSSGGLAGQNWPIRRVGLDVNPLPGVDGASPTQMNVQGMPLSLAETIFQLRDDLSVELPTQGDRPGIQRFRADDNGTPNNPLDDRALVRANVGNYSWLATVVPSTADNAVDSTDALEALQPAHPAYGQKFYDVSVAVFYKRNPIPSAQTERTAAGELLPGGQLIIYDVNDNADALDAAVDGIRPGRWLAVAGMLPGVRTAAGYTPAQLLFKWYRILSIDDQTSDFSVHTDTSSSTIMSTRPGRAVMLEGADWPNPAALPYIPHLRTILLPGVIGVTTRSVRMEVDSPWTAAAYP